MSKSHSRQKKKTKRERKFLEILEVVMEEKILSTSEKNLQDLCFQYPKNYRSLSNIHYDEMEFFSDEIGLFSTAAIYFQPFDR